MPDATQAATPPELNPQRDALEIQSTEPVWNCLVRDAHNSVHEVGCPHRMWTAEQLQDALVTKKRFEAWQAEHLPAIADRILVLDTPILKPDSGQADGER